jgi:hypothetical protein
MQVDTRDGIFATRGYGGGIFNLNVGYGGLGRTNERLPSGLGALGLGAVIPWYCWDIDGFKHCHAGCWEEARDECSRTGARDMDACIEAQTLQCATTHCVPIYCAAASAEEYPWRAYSTSTVRLQGIINEGLEQAGYDPIQVDGKIGPATCGAADAVYDFLGQELPEVCYAHRSEWIAPTRTGAAPVPVPVPAPAPAPAPVCPPGQVLRDGECVAVAPVKTGGVSKAWLWVGGLGLAAAAAGVYALRKK